MHPILRRALLAASLAAFMSAPAFSCKYCDAPPLVPPQASAPDEPVDLRSAPGLLPEELEYLKGLESGRFVRRGDYLDDTKASDPAAHLLTNAAAEPLLKGFAQSAVAGLREKQEAKTLQDPDRKLALLLYWYRGPLLTQPDRDFLLSLNPTALKGAPTRASLGGQTGPGPASATAAAGLGLTERLLGQLELPADAGQNSAARQALTLMLATPTGRRLAEELLATGAKSRVCFVSFPNSQVLDENGKKLLHGTYAVTDTSRDVIEVRFNQDFLKTDAFFRQRTMTSILGHELLGHGLESVKAKKAGVWLTYNNYYRENETNARLVGWLVEAELGGKIYESEIWRYLRDPEEYHRALQVTHTYYSTTFNPREAKDPAGTLRTRLARAQAALAGIPKQIANWESWRPIIEHFVSVHKLARERFRSLVEQIDNMAKEYLPTRIKTLQGIAAHLEEAIARFSGSDGAAQARSLTTQMANPFFAQEESLNQDRRTQLEALVQGKTYTPFSPPPAGQVTLEELGEMIAKDKKDNPGHWKK